MSKITNALNAAIVAGVTTAVASPTTDATMKDRKQISDAVIAQAGPVIANAANEEPLYQSRVLIGSIVGFIAGCYGLFIDFYDGIPPTTDSLIQQLTVIGGAALVIYGRLVATKPLFSGWGSKP